MKRFITLAACVIVCAADLLAVSFNSVFKNGSRCYSYELKVDKSKKISTVFVRCTDASGLTFEKSGFQIEGYLASNVVARPVYNSTQIDLLSRVIWVFSQSGNKSTTLHHVLTDSNFTVIKEWRAEATNNRGSAQSMQQVTDEGFFNEEKVNCLPDDRGTQVHHFSDCYTETGGCLYLRSDFNSISYPWTEGQDLPPDPEIKNGFYYYEPESFGYKRKWQIALHENWIVSYKIYCFDDVVVLYTSFKTNDNGSVSYKTKIRVVDLNTGNILREAELPKRVDSEFMLSCMQYDSISGAVYITGDYIPTSKPTAWTNQSSRLSSFVMAKFDSSGVLVIKEMDLKYSDSDLGIDAITSVPMLSVQRLEWTADGNLVVAALMCYWQGYKSFRERGDQVTAYNYYPFLKINGICVLKCDKQFNILIYHHDPPPADFEMDLVVRTFDVRYFHLGILPYQGSLYTNTYWDSSTETMMVTQTDYGLDPSIAKQERDLFAFKYRNDKVEYYKKINSVVVDPSSFFVVISSPLCLILSPDKVVLRRPFGQSEFEWISVQ